MERRIIILEVDPSELFDNVAQIGAEESANGIGTRIMAALLGGLCWRESVGLKAAYGITATQISPSPKEG